MLTDEQLLSEATKVIEAVEQVGLPARLMGAVAIRLTCSNAAEIYDRLGRQLSDIDLMAYWKVSGQLESLLNRLGYFQDRRIVAFHEVQRNFYTHKDLGIKLDVFFDKLKMCHEIDFTGRLELHPKTITLTDLFLEKIQIVKISEKDIKDLIVLLKCVDLTEDEEGINVKYIADRMSWDWGFYYTTTINLNKVKEFLQKYSDKLREDEMKLVKERIALISAAIESKPKSAKWRFRAKIGPAVKWYNEVEDLIR
ncbi:MAG: hypothetical protein ACK4TI_03535 [Nitrososphaerales archaeon]